MLLLAHWNRNQGVGMEGWGGVGLSTGSLLYSASHPLFDAKIIHPWIIAVAMRAGSYVTLDVAMTYNVIHLARHEDQ